MRITLRSLANGKLVSAWDDPHLLIANRDDPGIGEQFELTFLDDGPDPQPEPPAPFPTGNPLEVFMALVKGKSFGQQTLLDLEPLLTANGWQLTPPNAVGDRTKVYPPGGPWIRVGFGEGHWVWLLQPTVWDVPRNVNFANPHISRQFIIDRIVEAYDECPPGHADYWMDKLQEMLERGVELGMRPPERYLCERLWGRGAGAPWIARHGPYAGLNEDQSSRTPWNE